MQQGRIDRPMLLNRHEGLERRAARGQTVLERGLLRGVLGSARPEPTKMRTPLVLSFLLPFLACSAPLGCTTPQEAGAPALASSASAPRGASGAKRAFEIADCYRVKQVGSPALSPDGRRVAFQV